MKNNNNNNKKKDIQYSAFTLVNLMNIKHQIYIKHYHEHPLFIFI